MSSCRRNDTKAVVNRYRGRAQTALTLRENRGEISLMRAAQRGNSVCRCGRAQLLKGSETEAGLADSGVGRTTARRWTLKSTAWLSADREERSAGLLGCRSPQSFNEAGKLRFPQLETRHVLPNGPGGGAKGQGHSSKAAVTELSHSQVCASCTAGGN